MNLCGFLIKKGRRKQNVRLAFVLILLGNMSVAHGQWYVGPGLTNFDLRASDSNVSLDILNGLSNGQGTTAIESGPVSPTIAIGRTFGSNNQWSIETTIGTGSDTTITVDGQPFADLETIPLNVFLTYLGQPLTFSNWSGSIRPLVGGGLIYTTQSNTRIVDPTIANLGNPKLNLTGSTGIAALVGANIQLRKRMSLTLGLIYADGLETDISVENPDTNFFGFNIPGFVASVGSLEFSALITSARIQFAF